jgi:sugar phosphate isomerase/epimerase
VIAVSSPYFSTIPFPEALAMVSKDFRAWEIVAEGRHNLPEIEKDFRELTPSYDLSFSVHAPMSDINIGSLNPRLREASLQELLAGLGTTHRLGLEVFTIHPGFMTPIGMVSREKVRETVQRSLKRIDALAEDTGVKVALENMPRGPFSMCEAPSELLEMLDGTSMGVCFDVGHANTMGNIDAFLELIPRFRNVHVHDNMGERDEHLPIGDGTVDFPTLLRRLRDYRGGMVIESRGFEDAVVSKRRLDQLLA